MIHRFNQEKPRGSGAELLKPFPAGIIEEADPAQTARREVYEEVGLQLRDLEHAGRVWTSPGISTGVMDRARSFTAS
jgi:8-oxo-dGTP pyrophosphatase MutT (NUDIX family)